MFKKSRSWGSSGASVALLLLIGCASNDGSDPSLGTSEEAARGLKRGGRPHGPGRVAPNPPRGHGHGHGPGIGRPPGGHHPGRPGHHHGPGCGHSPPGAGGSSSDPGAGGSGASSAGGPSSGSGATGAVAGAGGNGSGGTFPGAGGSAGAPVGVCGDGLWDWFEHCDDGNLDGGDGCDPGCVLEAGYNCDDPSACHPVVCGDGVQEGYGNGDGTYGYEGCEDGNPDAGDGCSDQCQLEPGFVCPDGQGQPCREVVCGDGFQDGYFVPGGDGSGGTGGTGTSAGGSFSAGAGGGGGFVTWVYEECDDGNASSTDGCSSACAVEPGYVCDMPGVSCRIPTCGDGHQDFIASGGTGGTGSGTGATGGFAGGPGGTWETCDDGNTVADDGCSDACELESGWICDRPGVPCRQPRCGDGFIDYVGGGGSSGSGSSGAGGFAGQPGSGYEQCDDGNVVDDDGCTSSCAQQPGWVCRNAGEACYLAVCGDGVWDWPVEDCDDGNDVDDDGCSDCRYDFGGVGGAAGAGGSGFGGFGFSGGGGSGG